ncbi:hypothetical protein [Levilactobacillus cerevisiae]|uniref:hypothetical protein n=1 Tax=Levilactobacillus cerevisiae TaxID=1704076 RepID=UPI000F7A64CA|nr:hypothetical protein [Levilactobacillus cerevisiae]
MGAAFGLGLGQTTANAATITTKYTKLTTKSSSRNLTSTGNYALYTKPGTTKGAKLVVSKKLMKTFGTYSASDRTYFKENRKNRTHKGSGYYFHAYGYEVTSTGAIYYRVVTMNGKYRGYVYGGKTLNKYSGGVKRVATTESISISSTSSVLNTTTSYYPFKSIWTYPKYSQYGAKLVIHAYDYPTDKLLVVKAVERTREHDSYLYVKNQSHPKLSGWTTIVGGSPNEDWV